ncbi:hypothetical protein Amsp01_008240 [Amycolatopsis sp. NBRC 101858]|uniref:DUF3761 domain-containing protein n=1 Tax=Amycolatopsis sp. NBRC 101858 TaxID=3032200 RepID=UPI00249FB727|nr:DUF3761 domain-containing protein [Amycolatopsis sp. NBRC 101858]GLY34800.1 hypothetical protein Amsp01_008240 [Amycolatopsis sp. NBRC 101858]
MSKKLGLVLAAGLLVAGCGVGAVSPKDAGNVGVLDAPTSTYSMPTYSVPVTTAPPTSDAPVVTTTPTQAQAVAPKTTAAKPKAAPKTTAQAAPKPAECGADYYVNSSGNCVHRPSDNPSGATALCKDGSYSYSQHRSGTCSGHGGVRTWL